VSGFSFQYTNNIPGSLLVFITKSSSRLCDRRWPAGWSHYTSRSEFVLSFLIFDEHAVETHQQQQQQYHLSPVGY